MATEAADFELNPDADSSGDDDPTGLHAPVAGLTTEPLVHLTFGALSDPGRVRSNNEDHFLVATLCKSLSVRASNLQGAGDRLAADERGHLLVVADGMGGAAAGEQASALAIASVEQFVLEAVEWFLHLPGSETCKLKGELRDALSRADRTLIDRATDDRTLKGMGTTLTLAYSVAADLFIVHAGDSRAYLYRDGQLEQITRDHTLVQMMVDGGLLSAEQAKNHHRRHVVTNVLGGPSSGVEAEIHKIAMLEGDVLLLCTDGLSEPVDDGEIAAVLAAEPDPDAACRRLIATALARGGPDNVTAIVARYNFDPAVPLEDKV